MRETTIYMQRQKMFPSNLSQLQKSPEKSVCSCCFSRVKNVTNHQWHGKIFTSSDSFDSANAEIIIKHALLNELTTPM